MSPSPSDTSNKTKRDYKTGLLIFSLLAFLIAIYVSFQVPTKPAFISCAVNLPDGKVKKK